MTSPASFEFMGKSRIDVLVGAEQSSGQLTVFTETCGPGYGPPPHIHQREDEYFLKCNGDFEIFDGDKWQPLAPMGHFAKRGQPHTWRNSSVGEATILIVTSPGGFEALLWRVASLRMPADADRIMTIAGEYGVSFA